MARKRGVQAVLIPGSAEAGREPVVERFPVPKEQPGPTESDWAELYALIWETLFAWKGKKVVAKNAAAEGLSVEEYTAESLTWDCQDLLEPPGKVHSRIEQLGWRAIYDLICTIHVSVRQNRRRLTRNAAQRGILFEQQTAATIVALVRQQLDG